MKWNINFKQGCRRLALVILSIYVIYFLLRYIFSGCIFLQIDYIEQAKVINLSNKQELSLIDFSQEFFEKEKSEIDYRIYDFNTLGFSIHPYRDYFKNFDGQIFKNNEVFTVDSVNYQIKLPGKLKYLFTQFLQFLLIPLFAFVMILLYLLIEKLISYLKAIIIWIIKGFKQ